MSAALKPSEVLAKAADLIEPEGRWTQKFWRNHEAVEPCYCAEGAITHAAGLGRYTLARIHPAATFFTRVTGASVVFFNDAPGRTQAEVVAALRKASELAKAEGQ